MIMMILVMIMMNIDSYNHWIKEISEIIDEDDIGNVVKFALSYTLQSLRYNKDEVFNKFKWEV